MNTKSIAAILLGCFVLLSLGYVVLEETGTNPPQAHSPEHTAARPDEPVEPAMPNAVTRAYYFHRTQRCPTCRSIEANTDAALREACSVELQAGLLSFESVNLDEPENAHFVQDFALATSSVVLSLEHGRKPIRWTNLDRVWPLAHEPEALKAYVAQSVRQFMSSGS